MAKLDLSGYLAGAFQGFRDDPPDSPFQRGYLAALVEVAKIFATEVEIANLTTDDQ